MITGLHQLQVETRNQVIRQLQSVVDIKNEQINEWLGDKQKLLALFLANSSNDTLLLQSLQPGNGQHAAQDSLTRLFSDQFNVQTDFTEFFAYDMAGNIIASSSSRQIGKIVTAEPYYKASLLDNYIQLPYYEVGAAELNMIASSPVKDANGNIVGVLAGRLNLTDLSKIMTERSGLGNTGETYLVSVENNYLVTASRFDGYPQTQAYHSEGIDNALAGIDGSGTYLDYRNQRVIGIYRWMPTLQVALIAEIDEAEALGPLNQVELFSLIIAILAALIAAALGVGVSLWLARPVRTLTETATAIAGGDYNRRAPITRQNEIGQLAYNFNRMTDRLVETIAEINLRIDEIRRANEAAHAKEVFLATMSHELRTPLHAIIGFLGILKMNGGLEERSAHIVERIRVNAERLLALINDILEISRIESGKLEISRDTINVRHLVETLYTQMYVLAENKGLKFTTAVSDDLPPMMIADQDALLKILTNLLGNAFKFTHEGEVSLKVSGAGGKISFEVKDTGIGIAEQNQEGVFDSFTQVDSSMTRAYGGTGLGLSIVRRLCRAMNGDVTLQSALGKGSTFTVTLPLELESQLEGAV